MTTDNGKRSTRRRLSHIVIRIVIPVLFAGMLWHIFTNMARFGTVVSESMGPTLQVGDYYVLRVDAYEDDRPPQRGDVVVFDRPGHGPFAKRVIGVPGDEIGIGRGQVWLNGTWLQEPYLKEEPDTELPMAIRVREGYLFVLGDNRNHSEDSRDHGPVPVENVIGKVTKIVWPPGRVGRVTPVDYQ